MVRDISSTGLGTLKYQERVDDSHDGARGASETAVARHRLQEGDVMKLGLLPN